MDISAERERLFIDYQRELKQYAPAGDPYGDNDYKKWYRVAEESKRNTIIDIWENSIAKTKLIGFIMVWDKNHIEATYIQPAYRHQQRVLKALTKYMASHITISQYSLVILDKNTPAKAFWGKLCSYHLTMLRHIEQDHGAPGETLYYFNINPKYKSTLQRLKEV